MDLFYYFQQGGPLMWVILATGVVGFFIVLERLYVLKHDNVVPRAFVNRIRSLVTKGKTAESQLLCEENNSCVARTMAAALSAYGKHKSRAEIKEAVQEVGAREVTYMDKRVEIVGTLASIAPMLGLLGTVFGMIRMFQSFVKAYEANNHDPTVFAEGIWTALITTAYGLMMAIPLLLAYKYLQGRNDRLVNELEEDAMGLVELLDEQPGSPSHQVSGNPTLREQEAKA